MLEPIKSLRPGAAWLLAFAGALTSLLAALNYLPALNGILVPIFAVLLLFYRHLLRRDAQAWLMQVWLAVVITGLFLAIYRPAGFEYPLVFSMATPRDEGSAFNLHINTSKALAGYLILLLLLPLVKTPGKIHIASRVKQVWAGGGLSGIILFSAYFLLELDFQGKPAQYILAFGLVNLLVTCVAEEAFMRLIFQTQLILFISRYTGKILINQGVPLAVTTALFVVVHPVTSVEELIIYSLAGAAYGLIYALTKNVFASIGTHFLVNAVHFSFLTYPL